MATADVFGGRPSRRSPRMRWAVTVVATITSLWVLDVAATATGLAVAGSAAFADVSAPVLVALVVASYACWVVGLANNLVANGRLLDAAGVSTNAASKLAHDLAARHAAEHRRAAAASGYIVTEAVKELPYIVGAFGAAAASGSITRRDAAVFLIGANLGAAGYELLVAAGTRAYLRRRPRRRAVVDRCPGDDATT